MKHGKKPTREERKIMERWGLKAADWLVTKDTPEAMTLVHRHNDKTIRQIPKGD